MCAAAALLVFGVRHSLLSSVDSTAKERAADAATLPATDGVLPTSAEADNVVQIVDARGSVVASTPNVVGEPRLFTFAPSASQHVRAVRHVQVPNAADSYRVAVAAAGDGRIVYAAVPSDDEREAVRRIAVMATVGLPVVIALLTLLTWLLVGRALRPVEVASRRQREFVADAAHELRSPLASLRTQVEVAAADPDDERWRESVPALITSVDRVSALVDDLLQLAKLDGGSTGVFHVLDLDDIVFAESTRARAFAPVDVDVSGVTAAQVSGDGAALTRLVRNLLDNAVRHAATRVAVSLVTDGGVATLTVADDGPGVPLADRSRIFERFTRLDDARTRSAGGAGLGLAIVHDVTAAHGGSVEVADSAHGATFVVRLPAVGESAANRYVVRQDAPPAR
jgi:signal transduction histidine kinase